MLAATALVAFGALTDRVPAETERVAPPTASASIRRPVLTLRVLGPAAPVVGALVCAAPVRGDGATEVCSLTAADGRAVLILSAATHFVRAEPPAGTRLEVARQAVSLSDDLAVELALTERAIIAGTVRADDGDLLAEAEVCAWRAGEQAGCVRSDATGAYRLAVAPAVYVLRVEGRAGSRLVGQWANDRVDSGDADAVDVRALDAPRTNVTLNRGVVLSGVVRAGLPDRHPIERAQVCTKSLAAPVPFECERTASDGTYRALRVPGRYWVWVIPPDGEPLVAQWFDRAQDGVRARPVELAAEMRLDVALEPGPRITGRVRTEAGVPVAGAKICADTPFATGRICRETDGTGAYAITARPETYVLNVQPPEGSDLIAAYHSGGRTWVDAERVVLPAGGVRVDLVLASGVRIAGTVRDATGVPVADANVSLSDAQGWLAGASTDAAGRYAVVVPRGTYSFEVFAPRFGALASAPSQAVVVVGATTLDATLPLGPP